MTCPLPRPTPDTLWTRIANAFSANVLGGAPLIPESNEWYVVANDTLAAEAYYSIAEQQWKERDPRYCCCDNLTDMAAKRGVYPRPARRSQGYVTLIGTAGASLVPTMTFLLGEKYYDANNGATVPTVIGSNGTAIVPVIAQVSGAAGNTFSVTSGTLVTSLTGVNATVTPCGTQFCNGSEAETCEAFRTRYLNRLKYAPAGNMQWAIDKLLEYPCVTRVAVRNCTCCDEMYRVELYPFFDGSFAYGIPPAQVLADLQTWFFGSQQGLGLGQVGFGIFGTLYAPTAAGVDVNIAGLECLSSDTVDLVKAQVASLFAYRSPNDIICLRNVELVVAQVIGNGCNFAVTLLAATGATGLTRSECGDIDPACDVLPYLHTLTVASSAC